MKKAILIVMVLTLMMTCVGGISEISNKNMIERDFGDFIMTMDKDMTYVIREREDEDGWLEFIPYYGKYDMLMEHDSKMSCFWLSSDMREYIADAERFAKEMADDLESIGEVNILEARNGMQDGKSVCTAKLSCKVQNVTLYFTHRIVSIKRVGAYWFMELATNKEELNEFDKMFNSIKWNKNIEMIDNKKSELITYSFDDFIMTFESDMVGHVNERKAYKAYFKLYPNFDEEADFHQTINCVWSPDVGDLTKVDANEFANMILRQIPAQFKTKNINVENVLLLLAQPDEIDGKYAISFLSQYDIDENTIYMMEFVVSDSAFGTYTFSVGFDDVEQMDSLLDIVNTIIWTK